LSIIWRKNDLVYNAYILLFNWTINVLFTTLTWFYDVHLSSCFFAVFSRSKYFKIKDALFLDIYFFCNNLESQTLPLQDFTYTAFALPLWTCIWSFAPPCERRGSPARP